MDVYARDGGATVTRALRRKPVLPGAATVRAVLEAFHDVVGGSRSVGYSLGAGAPRWFEVIDGAVIDADQRPVDLTGTFELTAFTPTSQLLWRHISSGAGAGILSQETAVAVDVGELGTGAPWRLDDQPSLTLLWGSVTAARSTWVRLEEQRVAPFWVPLMTGDDDREAAADAAARGGHVQQQTVEYAAMDRYGNARVVAVRQSGLVIEPEVGTA